MHKIKEVPRTCDISQLIQSAADACAAKAAEKNVEVRCVLPELPVAFRCRGMEMMRSIVILLETTLETIEQNGWIEIKLRDPKDDVLISIEDSDGQMTSRKFEDLKKKTRNETCDWSLPAAHMIAYEHLGALYCCPDSPSKIVMHFKRTVRECTV